MICDKKKGKRGADGNDAVAQALTSEGGHMRQSAWSDCLKLRIAHWYLSRPHEADIPQAHGKPTRAHRKPSFKAACSHKCREDGRLTLIVAKSPQDDLVVP